MRLLIDLVPLLLVVGVVVLLWQNNRLTAEKRRELNNLRVFKNIVQDQALNEIEIDATNAFARIVLDEAHRVDLANNPTRKELP